MESDFAEDDRQEEIPFKLSIEEKKVANHVPPHQHRNFSFMLLVLLLIVILCYSFFIFQDITLKMRLASST